MVTKRKSDQISRDVNFERDTNALSLATTYELAEKPLFTEASQSSSVTSRAPRTEQSLFEDATPITFNGLNLEKVFHAARTLDEAASKSETVIQHHDSAIEDEDHDSGEAGYEVETIVAHRRTKDGGQEYRVKWKGYAHSDNTWEPEENMADAPEAIREYEDLIDRERAASLKRGKRADVYEALESAARGNKATPRSSQGNSGAPNQQIINKTAIALNGTTLPKSTHSSFRDIPGDVEAILSWRWRSQYESEYLVRWKGRTVQDDTWEPKQRFNLAKRLLHNYHQSGCLPEQIFDRQRGRLVPYMARFTQPQSKSMHAANPRPLASISDGIERIIDHRWNPQTGFLEYLVILRNVRADLILIAESGLWSVISLIENYHRSREQRLLSHPQTMCPPNNKKQLSSNGEPRWHKDNKIPVSSDHNQPQKELSSIQASSNSSSPKYRVVPGSDESSSARLLPRYSYSKHDVASKVLLAAGRHPRLPALNARMGGLLDVDWNGSYISDPHKQHQRGLVLQVKLNQG